MSGALRMLKSAMNLATPHSKELSTLDPWTQLPSLIAEVGETSRIF